MSPTSCQLLYSAIFDFRLVPVTGLEPVRYCYREILSLLCLPFHHTGGYWQGLEYHTGAGMSTLFPRKLFDRCVGITMMCELNINHVIIIKNLSDKNSRRCQLVVNSLSTKWLKVNKSGDKSQQRKFKKCPIYAGLRHFTRGKNNIIAALITRRSLVQIQLPQPHFSSRNAESTRVRRFLLLFGIDEKQRFGDYLGIIHIFSYFRRMMIL